MVEKIKDLSSEVVDRVSYSLSKNGETTINIRGFQLSAGEYSSAPSMNSESASLAILQQKVPLTSSPYGGYVGPGNVAMPDFESKLKTFATDEDWNLIKYNKGDFFQVLLGQGVLDEYVITDNEDGTYDIEVTLDSGDYKNAEVMFTDEDGVTETVVIASSTSSTGTTSSHTFTKLTGDIEDWGMNIFLVTTTGNYLHVEVAAGSLEITTVS